MRADFYSDHLLAREHSLSSYTPVCLICGLIICSLNPPQYACPHCTSPLITETSRGSLISRLESQISDTLAKEADDRRRAVERAQQQAGAFPSLAATSNSNAQLPAQAAPSAAPRPHKVLSLNSGTKKATMTISSFPNTPVASRPVSRAESEEDEPNRVPRPQSEVTFAKRPVDPNRPWVDLMGSGAKYVPDPTSVSETKLKGKSRRNRGKAKEIEPSM